MAETDTKITLYRQKREELNWSREYASEQLGMSDDKLERIENEKQLPNAQDVLIMSQVYKSPELCNYFCHRDCEIGQRYIPEVPNEELPGIILHLLGSIYEVEDIERILVKITADNQIREDEIDDLATAQCTLEQLSIMIEALQLCVERKIHNGELPKDLYEKAYKKAEAEL